MGLRPDDVSRLLSMPDNVVEIVEICLRLEKAYYAAEVVLDPMFFDLRKSLEGVWGHDLPDVQCKD